MPTRAQFITTLQPARDIDCKIVVLDYDFAILDEISGRTKDIDINVDAESDVRRTATINIILKNDAFQTNDERFYWEAGNPYWFDKYIQIYVAIKDIRTEEYIWVNEGVYLINAPSITYSEDNNSLYFTAVDLMSKLTGMRNGELRGMSYTIPRGSTITGAVESVIREQGFNKYLIYTPPYETVPEDINIEVGNTAYDLLCQLRDINANWEFFFDVDGIFHFQQIPSGKVIVDQATGETGEPQPLVNNEMWDKLSTEYKLDTDFEDVKNYVEVLGKVHEPNEFATVNVYGNNATLKFSKVKADYNESDWIFGFGIYTSESSEYTTLATPITIIRLYDSDNTLMYTLDLSTTPITMGNEYYALSLTWDSDNNRHDCEYLGFIQPKALAIEDNPDSPFYVGDSTEYTCSTYSDVDFVKETDYYIADIDATTSQNKITVNFTPWFNTTDYSQAVNGTKWKFRVHVTRNSAYPITRLIAQAKGFDTTEYEIVGASYQPISLDYTQDYMVVLIKSNAGVLINVYYYPISANKIGMSTTHLANLPTFRNQVRKVFSGNEYDNIYTNSLAEQRARYEIYLCARLHDSISITTVPIYWLDVHQVIEYTLPNNTTGKKDLWLIKSISTEISPDGTQTVNAIRYYPLYADISLENLATQ
jgi:hypothetical protein